MQKIEPETQTDTRKVLNTSARRPGSRNWAKLIRTTLFIPIISLAWVAPATADSGALFFNLKFSTSGSSTPPAFGINLKQLEIVEEPWWIDREQSTRNFQGINLYSTKATEPGVLNQIAPDWRVLLNSDSSTTAEDSGIGEAVMKLVLTVGVIGLSVAAVSQEMDEGCSGSEVILTGIFTQGYGSTDWCHDE